MKVLLAGATGAIGMPSWSIRAAAPYVAAIAPDTALRVSDENVRSELPWGPQYPSHLRGLGSLATQHAA